MKLTGNYGVAAPRERVYAALTDPTVLQRLIEGCESLVRTDDGVYEARLRVGVGPVKGTFSGQARMENAQPPESYTLIVDGRGTPGWVRGVANMHLADDGTATTVTCDADVTVGGVIAAVGSRLIEATARRMMDQFFDRLGREFQAVIDK